MKAAVQGARPTTFSAQRRRRSLAARWTLSATDLAFAQSGGNPTVPQPFLEELPQEEREQNKRGVDQLRPASVAPPTIRLLLEESSCFCIEPIALEGEDNERLQWILNSLSTAGDGGTLRLPLGNLSVSF